jgi:hypothetical protein
MSRTEIAAIACRLLALAMFAVGAVVSVTFLTQLLSVYVTLREGMVLLVGFIVMIMAGVWLVVATYYWQRSDKLATQMVDNDPESVTWINFAADDVLAAGCRVIGVVMLILAARIAVGLAAIALMSEFDVYDGMFAIHERGEIVKAGTWAAIGLWSLFGARGIVRFIRAARRAAPPSWHTSRAEELESEIAPPPSQTRSDNDAERRPDTDDSPQRGGRP